MTESIYPKRIIITGASGEVGGALARLLARPGAHLSLWGRDSARLAKVADDCRAIGAEVEARSLDLTDVEGAIAALLAEDDVAPFDMAVFASGLGDIRAPGALVEDPAQVVRLAQINFTAPAALAAALAGRMAARGRQGEKKARIVIIGSAAAFHALPIAAAYAGSKAGLARFTEALRIGVRAHGVSVTLASPGFIDTAAGRAVPGARPMALSAEEAATRILRAALAGKPHLVTPWPFAVLRVLDRALPEILRARLLLALTGSG
ncbi:MAG: SDR family NAD(P)-dependent oxidoreductase [Sphingomonas bacterium]